MVQNYDSLSTQRCFESNPGPILITNLHQVQSILPVNSEISKGKSTYRPDVICHECHKPGHYRSQCPQRALFMDNDGNQLEDDVGEVEGEHNLDGDCSDEEGQNQLHLIHSQLGDPSYILPLSVVRCALSLPQ